MNIETANRIKGYVHSLLNEYKLDATDEDANILEKIASKEDAIEFNNYLDVLTKREVKVFNLMTAGLNFPLGTVVANTKLDTADFDFEQMEKAKLYLLDTTFEVGSVQDTSNFPVYTGSSLWTCKCKKDFIHSHFRTKCDKCGTNINKSKLSTKTIRGLFEWGA